MTLAKKLPLNENTAEIGKNLKAARKVNKMTQEDLAWEVGEGCSAKVISEYENGYVNMGVCNLIDMADALGVQPGQLMPKRETDNAVDRVQAMAGKLNVNNLALIEQMMKTMLMQQGEM